MIRDILHYENKIHLLRSRGEELNAKLIKKCQRRLRQLQKTGM